MVVFYRKKRFCLVKNDYFLLFFVILDFFVYNDALLSREARL